jgi:hypothetical protein
MNTFTNKVTKDSTINKVFCCNLHKLFGIFFVKKKKEKLYKLLKIIK